MLVVTVRRLYRDPGHRVVAGVASGIATHLGLPALAVRIAFIVLLLWWLHEYLLYLIEISHAAAISLAIDEVKTPGLQNPIAAAMSAGAVSIGVPHMLPLDEAPSHVVWPTLDGRSLDDLVEVAASVWERA